MEFLVSDPWAELIRDVSQSGCQYPEAGPSQPLVLRDFRDIWTSAVLYDAQIPQSVFRNALRKSHPLIEALHLALAKRSGKVLPPLSVASPILPIGELCQFALLSEAKSLAQNILPFYRFPSLWCPEGAYDEKEALWSIALLLRSFGKYLPIPPNPDPYFLALAKMAPKWVEEKETEEWGARLYQRMGIEAALASAGEGVPLGALRVGGVEIPAFGPHTYPLSDPSGFGIRRTYPDHRWAAAAAMPEVWFDARLDLVNGFLETRFFGLKMDRPLAFAFYVKAEQAEIDGGVIQPKSLRRYLGESKKIILERGGSRVAMQCDPSMKMEVIPLAGEGCFWNAEFLIAFEIPQIEGKGLFKLEIV
jgi:hypothetical protein